MATKQDIGSDIIELKKFHNLDDVYDINFQAVEEWRKLNPEKKVVGLFPVYVPSELIHAMGHLPVNLYGGGEYISISHADAILGSFICSISKSTTELMMGNELFATRFDGFVFPFICDVARNLQGIFQRRFDKNSYMLHLSQNFESAGSVKFMIKEYYRMLNALFPEEELDIDKLRISIKVFNWNRELQREIYELRRNKPWNVPLQDLYLVIRSGSNMPIETHNKLLEEYISRLKKNNFTERDAIRVVVTGNFCEQPPLDVIDLIEQVGCYVIDDDFMIGRRYIDQDINWESDDPMAELSTNYIHHGAKIATRFHEGEKGEIMLNRVKDANAQGVIFLTAKFCEPALDDLVLQQHALTEHDIQSVHIEFEERGSGYENIRLSLETFVESLLFD
ncbi:MAG: Benzoyl-CoA reductase subunit C [Candidatus Heimdallarchaeota archaeon LC_2]|nr:MAG: Benzoyl-CoA reductase subunit C [Candidatus Heimdallarchaeota archaeon LC_2]